MDCCQLQLQVCIFQDTVLCNGIEVSHVGCGEDAYRVTGHFSPMDMSLRIKAATLRVLLTREGHTTVRKYCQPTSTLLTRMC